MFYRGVIHTYDFDNEVGEIYIKEQSIIVNFNLKDLPNSTIAPEIGERVKFIIVDENNQKFAKYIIRLDNKNATTDHAVIQSKDTQGVESLNIFEKENLNKNIQKPRYVKKNIALKNSKSESKTVENPSLNQNNDVPQLKIDQNTQQNTSVGIKPTKHSKAILQEAETRLLQKIMSSNLQQEQAQISNNSKSDIDQNTNQVISNQVIDENIEKNIEKTIEANFEQNIDLNNVQSYVESSDKAISETSTHEGAQLIPEFELNYKILNEQQPTSTNQVSINDPIDNGHPDDEENSSHPKPMPEFELNFERLSNADVGVANEGDFETNMELPIASDQKKDEHTEAIVEEFELNFGRLASPQIQSSNNVDAGDSSIIPISEGQDNGIKESSAQAELLEFELNFNTLNINQTSQKNDAEIKSENEDVENNKNNAELYSELLNVDFELNFEKLNTDLVILEGENSPDRTAEVDSDRKLSMNEADSANSNTDSVINEDIQKLVKPAPPVLAQANMVNEQNSSDNLNFPYQANIKKFERLKETIGVDSLAETNEKPSFQGQVKAPDPTIVAEIQNKNKVPLTSKVNHSVHKQNYFSYASNQNGKKKIKKKKSEKFGLKVLMVIIGSLILINGSLWGYKKYQQYKADQEAKLKIYMLEQEKKIEEQRRALGKLPDKILSDEALDDLLGKDRNK